MEIQVLNHHDIKFIDELQPEGWDSILHKIIFYIESSFCFPIKVVIDDKIVGIGATIIHEDTAWLGHIIVRKENRGKGIGKLITQKLVEIAKQKQCQTILLIATDLGAPIYEKVGFITETEYLFFKDISFENLAHKTHNIHAYKDEYKNDILILDKINSDENRICQLEKHLINGFVYNEKTVIEGFYLPTFGEGLIIANNSIAGIELLKFHLKTNNKVVLPKENTVAIQLLYENGFKEYRTEKRMILGKINKVKLSNIYNRIGGNLG